MDGGAQESLHGNNFAADVASVSLSPVLPSRRVPLCGALRTDRMFWHFSNNSGIAGRHRNRFCESIRATDREGNLTPLIRDIIEAKDIATVRHLLLERLQAAGCSIEDVEKTLGALASTLESSMRLELQLRSFSDRGRQQLRN